MKVLIADSVRVFQQFISGLFRNTGLIPVVAKSGEECLAALAKDRFGFICISMYMEGVNGIELCRSIRKTAEHVHPPIILFTSEDSARLLSEAIAAGVTEIFNKSKDLDQLVAYIKRFTLQHQPIDGQILYVEDSRSLRLNIKELHCSRGMNPL